MYTCFFLGHRDAPGTVQEGLNETVEKLVTQCGVSHFIVGHYGNFDRMATIAVRRTLLRHPDKTLEAVLLEPYFPGDRKIPLPDSFTGIFYPGGMEAVPQRYCIEKANRKALESADYLVSYVCRQGGNAAKLLRVARRLEAKDCLHIINLGTL